MSMEHATIAIDGVEGSQRSNEGDLLTVELPSRDRILDEVKEVMGTILGVKEVRFDLDGDILVRVEDILVHVGVMEDRPLVRVVATALSDLGSPASICRSVNEINLSSPFAKAVWTQDKVVFAAEVIAFPLAAAQLIAAFEAVHTLARHWAGELQVRFGGRTEFGRAVPPKAVGPGGYL